MNQMNKEEQLDGLSYLWTSGEWTLHCFYHSRARNFFMFPAGRPSLKDLLAIRSLIPRFTVSPMSLLKNEVGLLSEFAAGEFPSIEARRLESRARARGLAVRIEDASFKGYLPVNVHGSALIIEDNQLASL